MRYKTFKMLGFVLKFTKNFWLSIPIKALFYALTRPLLVHDIM